MILVTAATGHLGRLVVQSLARQIDPSSVVAGVRDPGKATDLAALGVVVRTLDYDRPDTVRDALVGVDQVLLISGNALGRRADQHGVVIDAAVAAGVEHLAYTSVLRADTSTISLAPEHLATERLLEASGLTGTLLRNGWYVENYLDNLGPALEHGTFVGSSGDGRIAAATRADLAAAAAAVLVDPGLRGRTFELAGPSFTMTELAAAVSSALGREITYTNVDGPTHLGILVGAGLPVPVAEMLVGADRSILDGELDGWPADLEALIGRQATSLTEAAATAVSALAG